jgi:hypothetical protein
MVFGFIDEMINTGAKIAEDAIDVGLGALSMGEMGDLSKEKVARLISAGVTIYSISEATGIAVEVLEKLIEEEC